MAARLVAHGIHCTQQLPNKDEVSIDRRTQRESTASVRVKTKVARQVKRIVLQPRLCTLRSYADKERGSAVAVRKVEGEGDDGQVVPPFYETLSEYIDSSKKIQDFEIISGRLAMIVFAVTVATEVVTGNSVFHKIDVEGVAEAAGVCFAAVTCAASFAWVSRARGKVGRIFTLRCNAFIDSLIDDIVDSLFYDTDPTDWTD